MICRMPSALTGCVRGIFASFGRLPTARKLEYELRDNLADEPPKCWPGLGGETAGHRYQAARLYGLKYSLQDPRLSLSWGGEVAEVELCLNLKGLIEPPLKQQTGRLSLRLGLGTGWVEVQPIFHHDHR